MSVIVATLNATWTDNENQAHTDTVQVKGPSAVPDPDVPVVILLHGLAGSSNDLSLESPQSYEVDMSTPIETADRGIQSYPGVGTYGFATDALLNPAPAGWEPYLLNEGYLTLNYTQVSATGSLALVGGRPSDPVLQLHAIITCVAATFPGRRIAFVTHSRGGLLLRAWLIQHGNDTVVRPRLGTAVQLAAPDQGSSLANIAASLNAEFVALSVLAESFFIPIMQTPLYQEIENQADWPGLKDLQVGSAFLQWLAASEPASRPGALLELATFGGTNPNLTRCHLYVFTPQSAIPIFTWEGWYFAVTFHWYTWDVGFPVRNFPGDIGAALQEPAEIVPGAGDILVAAASASLPWQAEHYVNPVSHMQVMWDGSAKAQALPVLGRAWGSPAVQVEASWAVWSHPAEVLPGSRFTISVTVTNVGTVAWPSGYVLAADDGSGHAIWGSSVAKLGPMPRGATATINLTVTTPTAAAIGAWLELDVYVAPAAGGQAIQRGQAQVALRVA